MEAFVKYKHDGRGEFALRDFLWIPPIRENLLVFCYKYCNYTSFFNYFSCLNKPGKPLFFVIFCFYIYNGLSSFCLYMIHRLWINLKPFPFLSWIIVVRGRKKTCAWSRDFVCLINKMLIVVMVIAWTILPLQMKTAWQVALHVAISCCHEKREGKNPIVVNYWINFLIKLLIKF